MTAPVRKNEIARFADSVRYVLSLDMKQKERLCDEIFQLQRELLFEAMGLHHLGVPHEKMDHVFHLLMVLYDYFHQRGKRPLPPVTEKMIDEAHRNIIGMHSLIEKEGEKDGWELVRKAFEAHSHVEALAYLFTYLRDNGFGGKGNRDDVRCIAAAKLIFDCLVMAEKRFEEERGGRGNG